MPQSELSPDAEQLERALASALPPDQRQSAATLARALVALLARNGAASIEPGAAELDAPLRELAGRTVQLGSTAIDFGSGNAFGDVTLRGDFAGRDVVKVNLITAETAYDVSGLPNPYLGLESFTYETRDRFGGREQQVADAVALLMAPGAEQVALFVTGASGSGKSSFVQAGLVPALERHYVELGKTVKRAVMRPGRNPIAALERADPSGAMLGGHTPPTQVSLLVLDQFEEAFTQADATTRAAFFRLIASLGSFPQVRAHVIATVRADYLPSLFEYPELFALVKRQGIELRGMSRSELARAIRRPLEAQNAASGTAKRWQPELVDRLVEDTLAEGTLLPLLQVTLESIWRRGRLTLDRYETLTDALEDEAETAYAYRTGPPQIPRSAAERAMVMSIFLDLVEVSLDDDPRRDVRRSVAKVDLIADHPERAALIDELVAARLLSVERRGEQQVDTVDIIHETLLRNWDRLRTAVGEQREALQQRERFRVAVAEWVEHQRDDGYALNGVRLAEGRALAAGNDIALRDPNARAFLARSLTLAERDRRRFMAIVAGVVGVVFVAAIVSLYLLLEAQRAREQTMTQEARELASSAVAQLEVDPERSLLLAMRAVDRAPSGADTREADAALRLSLLLSRVRATETIHRQVVTSAAYSPDGARVITASADGTVALWVPGDSARPTVLQVGGELAGAAFSPDGARLAAFGSTGAVVWSFVGGAPTGELKLGSGRTNALAFSPDGQWLVTGGDDRMARVWDTRSGQQLAALRTSGRVLDATVSANGQLVATAGSDGQIRIWEWRSSQPPVDVRHERPTRKVVFSPDNARLVSTSDDSSGRLWDVRTGEPRAVWPHERPVTFAAFSRDGARVVTASEDGIARVWDAESGAPVRTLLGHVGSIVSAFFDPTGDRIVTASTDGSARIWDLRSGVQLALLTGHAGGLTGAAFSPDGLQVVTSSWDATARVWDASVGKQPPVVRSRSGPLTEAAFSPDARWLLTVGTEPVARVWDARSGAVEIELPTGALSSGRFSPDGERIGIGGPQGRVSIWDWRDGSKLAELASNARTIGAVRAVAFSPDGTQLGLAGEAGSALWAWRTTSEPLPLGGTCADANCRHTQAINSIAFNGDGTRVVTTSNDTTARVWDAATGQPVGPPLAHANQLHDAIFWGVERVVTASADRTAHVWNLRTGREEAAFFGHAGIVNSVALSADGRWLVTASNDSTARVWDAGTRETVAILSGHVDMLNSASFSTEPKPRVVTAGADGSARVYTCEVCADLPVLRALAETRVTRPLTLDERRRFLREPQ